MSYNPGQPRQPRYQKTGRSLPQQPPYNIAMPATNARVLRARKTVRRWPWIIVAALCILILAGILVARYLSTLAGPIVTVDNYYQAVLQKNYTTAYSYLANGATLTSQNQMVPIGSQRDYTTSAQLLDNNIGTVTTYTVATTTNTALLTINTTRSKTAHSVHYSVRFTMVQVDGTWKIKDMNGGF